MKSLWRLLLNFLFFGLLSVGSIQASTAYTAHAVAADIESMPWSDVVDYAKATLPQEGHLQIKSNGFAYVKVDDDYIHELFPLLDLESEGYKKPPYFRSAEATGAHVSVFYEDEEIVPEEIGQVFTFTLKQIIVVRVNQNTFYAVLQVDSPELEALRVKYGCSPKLHGHEFHISLAKKMTSKK